MPHGTGIGDMVNLRPLLRAIAGAHPGGRVSVLADASVEWLLPEGVARVGSVHGVRPWRRLAFGGPAARAAGALSVPAAARLMRPVVGTSLVRLMTRYLELQEYPVVHNLLEDFALIERVRGRWAPGRRPAGPNLVDHLAAALEGRGVAVPPEARVPSLQAAPAAIAGPPPAVISPFAGSTLKEAPPALWRAVIGRLTASGLRTLVLEAPGRTVDPGLAAMPGVTVVRRPLPELVPILAAAAVFIGPDSGMLHVAAATGVPHVGLFGATEAGFSGPYPRPHGRLLQAPAEHPPVCRDCAAAQLLPVARCPVYAGATCLSTISAVAVVGAAESVARR